MGGSECWGDGLDRICFRAVSIRDARSPLGTEAGVVGGGMCCADASRGACRATAAFASLAGCATGADGVASADTASALPAGGVAPGPFGLAPAAATAFAVLDGSVAPVAAITLWLFCFARFAGD